MKKNFWQKEKEDVIRTVRFGGYVCLFFSLLIIFAFGVRLYDDIMYSKPINELNAEDNKEIFYLIKEASKEVLGEKIKTILETEVFIIEACNLSDRAKRRLEKLEMDPFRALVVITESIDSKTRDKLSRAIYQWKYYNDDRYIILSDCIIDISKNPFSNSIMIIPIKVKVYKN